MNRTQENSGAGGGPTPLKGTPTDIGTSADASLGNLTPTGFDNLPPQAGLACGQHPTGGTVPIAAPADAVQPTETPTSLFEGSPVPLRSEINEREYPLELLPEVLQLAISEVKEYTQAPTAMIAGSALSAISTAAQGLISVERDRFLRDPASLYLLTLAESGERKSTVDKFFTRSIRDWEAAQKEAAKPAQAEYKAKLTEWECLGEGYKQAIRNGAKNGLPDRFAAEQLTQLELNRPKEPLVPLLLRSDSTPEALGVALERYPVAAILSDEAGIIFGSHAMNPDSVMRNLSALNVCWDGGQLMRERTSTQSIDVSGMRVTMGLLVQPKTLEVFLGKQGDLAKGIGFLARFLVANPESTQGTRFYREPPQHTPGIDAFNQRIRMLLGAKVRFDATGKLETTFLTLSPEAKDLWVQFHDSAEEELGRGREFFDVKDVASKAADNAARLAALLHTFDDHMGVTVIGRQSMKAAVRLMHWYLHEALRFAGLVAVPDGIRRADVLEKWLIQQLRKGQYFVETNHARKYCPNEVRAKAFDDAVDVLEAHNRAMPLKRGQKKFICLNPDVVKEYRR